MTNQVMLTHLFLLKGTIFSLKVNSIDEAQILRNKILWCENHTMFSIENAKANPKKTPQKTERKDAPNPIQFPEQEKCSVTGAQAFS